MELYKLPNGGLAIIHEGKLFVEAEPAEEDDDMGVSEQVYKKQKPKKKKAKGNTANGKIDDDTKEILIKRLKNGEKPADVAREYGVGLGTIYYYAKKAGIQSGKPRKKRGVAVKDDVVEDNNKIQKMFSCACGRGYSAWVKDEPGEKVQCPDNCGNEMLASEGEEV